MEVGGILGLDVGWKMRGFDWWGSIVVEGVFKMVVVEVFVNMGRVWGNVSG